MNTSEYTFNSFNEYAKDGISETLKSFIPKSKNPIIICVGSDLVLGDSLGPLCGTMLKRSNVSAYIYGTLNYPVTAKEIEYAKTYIKQMHPNSVSIAIDAAVGKEEDVGLIKVYDKGLMPGLGVEKNLGILGDISIIGIVAPRSNKNYNLFNTTRLNLIFKMAEKISEGIEQYIKNSNKKMYGT